MRYYVHGILISVVLCMFTSIADGGPSEFNMDKHDCILAPVDIEAMIRRNDPRYTVDYLYKDIYVWQGLLKNIARGEDEWLEIAVHLKAGSDAGTSEMLNYAVGEALENAPERVLEITAGEYRLENICGGPDVDDLRYSTYEQALKSIELRIDSLMRVSNKRVEDDRNFCIKKLKESLPYLQRYYKAGAETQ